MLSKFQPNTFCIMFKRFLSFARPSSINIPLKNENLGQNVWASGLRNRLAVGLNDKTDFKPGPILPKIDCSTFLAQKTPVFFNPNFSIGLYIDAPGQFQPGLEYKAPSIKGNTPGHSFDLGFTRGALVEIVDPDFRGRMSSVDLPTFDKKAPEMSLGGGKALIWRHKSMKKHWRKKHFRRDIVLYRKRERKRKVAAEKAFRDRLIESIQDAENFNAKEYVENFLIKINENQSIKNDNLAFLDPEFSKLDENMLKNEIDKSIFNPESNDPNPDFDGKKKHLKYIHWTELITVEQLYGLPESSYIDKNAAKPDQEEWAKILELRRQYEENFRKFVKNLNKNEEKLENSEEKLKEKDENIVKN